MAFRGQVALVTGAGSGMGRVAVHKLAATGAHVAALDINEAGLAETAEGWDNVHPFRCDVTDLERVIAIIHAVEEIYGPIDRVVHAAGIMPGALVLDETIEQAGRIMDINYMGTLHLLLNTLPRMVERGSGDWIAFGSTAGYCPSPFMGAYSASKAAVNTLIETVYWENLHSGVRILLAAPPPVNTPLLDQPPPEAIAVRDTRSSNQTMTPEEMIDAIERDLEKGKPVCTGNTFGAMTVLMRRFIPTRLWKMALKANGLPA
jgi:NAD(P)-dependent dehydrogenase (short-subunit alcohol dehydrogenase family)